MRLLIILALLLADAPALAQQHNTPEDRNQVRRLICDAAREGIIPDNDPALALFEGSLSSRKVALAVERINGCGPQPPFHDPYVSNAEYGDVCAETDDVEGCVAATHRRNLCRAYLLDGLDRNDAVGLTCQRVICTGADYGDEGEGWIRARYCRRRP